MPMDSPTKRRLTAEEISAVARAAFGSSARVLDSRELTEGTFNASYALRLEGVPPLVLKVAPPPGAPLLRYERDLMRTELEFYERVERAGGGPVPRVLASGLDRKVIESEWFAMALLNGVPLYGSRVPRDDRRRIRARLGEVAGAFSKIRGERFGYPRGGAGGGATWREAFSRMVGDLLDDADQYRTRLPRRTDELRRLFERTGPSLDVVREPSLVHFDLWDGNVFVIRGPSGAWELEALIDGERAFWGDPLAELPSASLLGDIEREPDFLAGYARALGAPLSFTPEVRLRIALYRAYLYLIMLVEAGPRAYSGMRWLGIRTLVELRLRGTLRQIDELG